MIRSGGLRLLVNGLIGFACGASEFRRRGKFVRYAEAEGWALPELGSKIYLAVCIGTRGKRVGRAVLTED